MISKNRLTFPKETWMGWFSSAVEAYNIAIYSFMAPILAKSIFPEHDARKAVFFSYCLVFLASSFFYPLGAFYYGWLADKKGRQKTCAYSALGLAIATGLMGVCYDSGEFTWIIYLILISAQYFFSGGEYYGSIIFSLEHAKPSGLMSALSCLFAVLGLLAANGFSTFTRDPCFCFILGSLGGALSYLLKNYCSDTPEFLGIPERMLKKVALFSFVKNEWRKIYRTFFIYSFFIVTYSFIFIFLPLVYSQPFDTFYALIIYGFFLIIAGILAERFDTQILVIGSVLFCVSVIPLCYFCRSLWLLQTTLTILASLVIGPIHSWMLNQFETEKRGRGVFISSALATSIFGGSTIPLCLLLYEKTHSLAWCAVYPALIAFCAFQSARRILSNVLSDIKH